MEHFEVIFSNEKKKIRVHKGASLAEAAGMVGIILNTACGGKGTCGKCEVEIEGTGEKVLACQHCVDRDISIRVPAESKLYKHKILNDGILVEKKLNPCVAKNVMSGDRVKEIINGDHDFEVTDEAIKQGKDLNSDEFYTAVIHYSKNSHNGQMQVWGFEKGDTCKELYGAAIDIGTTTVVIKLVDLSSGEVLEVESEFNPQNKFGDDVISRINEAASEEKLRHLHDMIVECINEMIKRLCAKTGVSAENIYEVVVVGNTTMNHIFLNFPVSQLGQAPYEAHSVEAHERTSAEMKFDVSPYAKIYAVENIAGFVGADTVAASLAVEIDKNDDHTLLVDIGTNGEIVLGTKDKLYAASCAAGPALEGARIMQGSRAMEGAIESVVMNGEDIDIDVIGDVGARTICGSGLIDAVAIMLELGVVDPMGRMAEGEGLEKLSEKIRKRMTTFDGEPAFCISNNEDSGTSVVLTQKDIREVQLAKAAIRAGIEILLKKLELKSEQLGNLLLAGAFGNYIRKESAIRIGLLPDIALEKIKFVGNAAGVGAEWALLDRDARKYATRLAGFIEYAEIAHEADFSMVYADCMLF